jgi:hypothetical protein
LVEKEKGVILRRVDPKLAPAWRRGPEDDAMGSDSRSRLSGEGAEGFGPDAIETMIRERIRATIEVLIDEELEAALGAAAPKEKSRRLARLGERSFLRIARHPTLCLN